MSSAATRRRFAWATVICVLVAIAGMTGSSRTGALYSSEATSAMRVSTPEQCTRDGAPYDPYSAAVGTLNPTWRWTFGSAEDGTLIDSGRTGNALPVVGEGLSKATSDVTCGEDGALAVAAGSLGGVTGALGDVDQVTVLSWVHASSPGRLLTLVGPSCTLAVDVGEDGVFTLGDGVSTVRSVARAGEVTLLGVVFTDGGARLVVADGASAHVPCPGPVSALTVGSYDGAAAAGARFSDVAAVPQSVDVDEVRRLVAANSW